MRQIDADALIGALHNHAFLEGDDRSICYNIIQKQPTIDAVSDIQCQDCRFFLDNWRCVTWHMFVRPDGYCFRAERKPDADESV